MSWVAPHFPLTAPSQHFFRYHNQELPDPKLYHLRNSKIHPYVNDYRSIFAYDEFFESPDLVKRALAGYFGLISFLDEQVGLVQDTLAETGLTEETRIIYTSHHGDNMGARGAWGKSLMYEEAVAVPMLVLGSDIPSGKVVETPASLLDIYPFIMDSVGAGEATESDAPGANLVNLIGGADTDRAVLSEYHAMG